MATLSQAAIDAALTQNWDQAITINENIIKENEKDIEALARLAYACIQLGKFEKAKKIYRKILSLDKYNLIAQKNLDKISYLIQCKIKITPHLRPFVSPSLFIEEPGQTKTVSLTNTAPLKIISNLSIGDPVILNPKKHSVEVRTPDKVYLGALPDDVAFRLIRFIKAGNTYQALIKNIAKNCLTVYIRELTRGKRLKNQPTFFMTNRDFTVSTPREMKRSLVAEDEDDKEQDYLEE